MNFFEWKSELERACEQRLGVQLVDVPNYKEAMRTAKSVYRFVSPDEFVAEHLLDSPRQHMTQEELWKEI